MIKKVPNVRAWVFKIKDFRNWFNITAGEKGFFILHLKLPIWGTKLTIEDACYTTLLSSDPEEYICVLDSSEIEFAGFGYYKLTLEQVEAINKTWSEFYD